MAVVVVVSLWQGGFLCQGRISILRLNFVNFLGAQEISQSNDCQRRLRHECRQVIQDSGGRQSSSQFLTVNTIIGLGLDLPLAAHQLA